MHRANAIPEDITREWTLLTVDQVAQLVQISPFTLRTAVRNGHLRVVRIGKQIRIRPADLHAWVEGGGRSYS